MRPGRLLLAAVALAGALTVLCGVALAGSLLADGRALSSTLLAAGTYWGAWWPEVVMVSAPILGTTLVRWRG